MKKLFLLSIVFIGFWVCLSSGVNAQGVGINSSGNSADPSAILDASSTIKGALMPRMTTAERNAIVNPAFGLLIFNTTTACFNMWTGLSWKQVCGDCDFSNPVPGNNGPLCEGQTLNLSTTTISGATYQWSGPNGFVSTQQNPSIINSTPAASGSYAVSATLSGCTSSPQSTVATINPIPQTPVASNNGPLCSGQTLNLSATTITGASYSWTGANSFTANTQNTSKSNIQLADAGTYSVTATVNGCTSAAGTTSVSVNEPPGTPGAISGTTTVCANSTGNVYSIAAVPGATTYNWSVPSDATITSSNPSTSTSITVAFGSASGNIGVSVVNNCGTLPAPPLSVSVVTPIITLDATSETNGTGSVDNFPITTTGADEIILVNVGGCCATFNGSVSVTGATTPVQVSIADSGPLGGRESHQVMFACVATAAGSHTVTVSWGSNYLESAPNYVLAYAASFSGFCSTPTVAANVQSIGVVSTSPLTISGTITPAAANSYLFAAYDIYTGTPGTVTWTNVNLIRTDHPNDQRWDRSIAGKQFVAASPVTVTAVDNHNAPYSDDITMILTVIHP